MSEKNQAKYQAKMKRIMDVVELCEPDRVPIYSGAAVYPYVLSGHTMAEAVYDTSLKTVEKCQLHFMEHFDQDIVEGYQYNYVGQGPMLELVGPKRMRWAGMPGNFVPENSVHQFIEFPTLEEDDFNEFFSDRSGWFMQKGFFRESKLLEPFRKMNLHGMSTFNDEVSLAKIISDPEFKTMIETLWKINDMERERQLCVNRVNKALEDAGFPVMTLGFAAVPYDNYNDFFRGTMEGMTDLYDRPDDIHRFIEEKQQIMLELIKLQGQFMKGKFAFFALHKGMDGFMNEEHFKEFYWPYLQQLINAVIDVGMIPYVHCEGHYQSRLEFLRDVPKKKVIYEFETVNFADAKRILGDTACIAGGFPSDVLLFGTPEKVRDKVKEHLDICAPGGGYIFRTTTGIDAGTSENIEAMFEAVKEYGRY